MLGSINHAPSGAILTLEGYSGSPIAPGTAVIKNDRFIGAAVRNGSQLLEVALAQSGCELIIKTEGPVKSMEMLSVSSSGLFMVTDNVQYQVALAVGNSYQSGDDHCVSARLQGSFLIEQPSV